MEKAQVLDEQIIDPRLIYMLTGPGITGIADRPRGEASVDGRRDDVLGILFTSEHRLTAVGANVAIDIGHSRKGA